jgi:hypothetical protein
VPLDRGGQGGGEAGHGGGVVGQRDHRHDRVPVRHLDRHAQVDEIAFDGPAIRPGAGQQYYQLGRLDARAVEDVEPGHLAQAGLGRGDRSQQAAAQFLAIPGQQRPGRVDAGHDRAGRAGGVRGLEGAVQPRGIQPAGPGQHQRALGVGGQRLVRAGHHRVRARGDRVRRQIRMETQVCRPRRVHQQRDARVVGRGGVGGQVACRADVGRVAEEHGAGGGMTGQRGPHRAHRNRAGQPGRRVQVRLDPDRPQAGQHQAEQQRPVQAPGDDDLLARPPGRQGQGLVAVGRPGHREPAPVRAPQPRGPPLGVLPEHVGMPDRVEAAVQRRVAGHHRADQVVTLLVPRNAHRGERAGLGLPGEPQPGIEQRRVPAQPLGVAWITHGGGRTRRVPGAAGCCRG